MENQLGTCVKKLRISHKLLQRQVASVLEIDTPMLSKIERGERKAKKEQIGLLADIFNVSKEELLTLWLADQVYDVVKDEIMADNVLKSVSQKIKLKRK